VAALALVAVIPSSARAQETVTVGSRVGSAPPSGYDDGNRRDPFTSLISPKRSGVTPGRVMPGLAGLSVSDALVTGIVRAGKSALAIIQGPDGKSFTAHVQDRLQDAVIRSIDSNGVVFVAEISDAAGMTHPREIRKALHVVVGGGQ
jgi:hypothetical protein